MPIVETHKLEASSAKRHEWADQIYGGLDAAVTLECFEELKSQYPSDTQGVIYQFERALQAPLLDMMLRGFRVDEAERQKTIAQLSEEITAVYLTLQQFAKAMSDCSLNARSDKQLKHFFYSVMRLPPIYRSDKGVRKLPMDRDILEKLENYLYARPLIWCILSFRDLCKLRESLQTEIDPDGRFRTSYSFAETGRLKSSKSALGSGGNMQNLRQDGNPEEEASLPSVRRMFIADEGMKLCNIDLEQTEAYDVGWLHGTLLDDWTYLDAIQNSNDLHTYTSRLVWPALAWDWEIPITKHDREIADQTFYRMFTHRQMSKRGGFLSNYSGTAYTMSKALKIPIGVAANFQNAYCLGDSCAFPAFPKWWKYVAQELQTKRKLITPFGRERHFFGHPNDDITLREAIAYSPQSATADRMNLGMWRIWRKLDVLGVELLAQVHDSVCFQFPESADENEVCEAALELTRVLQKCSSRSMIVPAGCKTGWNWGEHHETLNPLGMKKWRKDQSDNRKRASS